MTQPSATISFFDLLGLDPDAEWDQARFETVLKGKQQEWSKNKVMGVGKKKAEAEEWYRLLPLIKAELSDPAKRQIHADRGRSERASGRQLKLKELEDQISMRAARGYLLEAEASELLKQYSTILGESAVRQLLGSVSTRPPDERPEEVRPLESSLAGEIKRDLARVGAKTLYEFLLRYGRPIAEKESTETLFGIAKGIYEEANNAPVKTTDVTLRATLAGHCQNCFSSEERRARYDATLSQERLAKIFKKAEMAAGMAKAITASQMRLLLEEASHDGLDPEEARDRIVAFARAPERRWAVEVPSLVDHTWCGCGELNPTAAERCRRCGQALAFVCPGCNRQAGSHAAACTNCGFPVGRRFRVQDLIDESRGLLDSRHVREARRSLADAAGQWPSTIQDQLSRELESLKTRIAAAVEELDLAILDVQHLVASKKYYAARARLLSLKRDDRDDPQLSEVRLRADKTIAEVERQIDALNKGPLTDDDVAVGCLRILDTCIDSDAARQILAQRPPAPPQHLQASLRGHVVSLSWATSTSTKVRYVVVRKSEVRPQNANEGERVVTVDDVRWEDGSPEIGIDVYYAVFADRGGVMSRTAAQLDKPLILPGEVSGLRAHIGDGEVRLDWNPPPNVHRVVATRTLARSGGGQNGLRLESIDSRQLVDRLAVNEHEYRYSVTCEFLRTNGETVISRGTDVVAMAQKRPATVEPFIVAPIDIISGRALRLSWQPPPKGEVWILNSTGFPVCSGQVIPARELNSHGEVLSTSGSTIVAPWQDGGVRYYTPSVVLGETAYVGSAHRYIHVEDVRELQSQNLGDRVRLSWEWPAQCTEVHLNASGTGWPLDDKGAAQSHGSRVVVARAEYDRHGYYDLRPSTASDLFIVVQAVTRAGEEQVVAPGTRCRVRLTSLVRLEYELRPRSLLRRSIVLAISTDKATELPPFRIVRKRGRLPQDREDGDCVLRQTGRTSVNLKLRVPLAEPRADGRAFGKLFLESDQDYDWITVLHPDRAKLKM